MGSRLPNVVAAEYRGEYRLRLKFNVAWPNGADIAPETLFAAEAVEDAA